MMQQATRGEISPDGQFQWDGTQWQPITGTTWQPTEWTRPMQTAVAAYWLISGLFGILTPVLFGQAIKDAALKQIQSQNPSLTADQQQQALNLGIGVAFAFAVIFGIIYLALAILSYVRRFGWVFYVDLVLLGLSAIGVVTNLVALGSKNSAQPALAAGIGLLLSLAALGLFVWMLLARLQRGVWACRKAPVSAANV